MTWVLYMDRNLLGFVCCCSIANRYAVLADGWVGYILQDHSATVNQVAQWFILYKRPKDVSDSISIRSVFYPS